MGSSPVVCTNFMSKTRYVLDGRELDDDEISSLTRDEVILTFLETVCSNNPYAGVSMHEAIVYAKELRNSLSTVRDTALKVKLNGCTSILPNNLS